MLEVNWSTLLLQVANFLIMVFILTRFLFKPLKKTLDKRAKVATRAMDEAEAASRDAEALKLEYERKHENIDAQFAALKNEARVVIDETRQQMLREAYEEIDAMRARAAEEIEQQRAEALRLHRSRIGELVTTLVRRMMEDVLDPTIHRAYLDAFLDQLRSTRLEERLAATGREDAIPVELITATAMAPEHESQFVATLESMVSHPIDVTHRVDPHLGAGAMARLGDLLIDGSLQGQLEQLRSRYEAEIE